MMKPILTAMLAAFVLTAANARDIPRKQLFDAGWQFALNDTYARHHTWNGRALIVVRSSRKSGRATVSVAAPQLPAARLTLHCRTAK